MSNFTLRFKQMENQAESWTTRNVTRVRGLILNLKKRNSSDCNALERIEIITFIKQYLDLLAADHNLNFGVSISQTCERISHLRSFQQSCVEMQ